MEAEERVPVHREGIRRSNVFVAKAIPKKIAVKRAKLLGQKLKAVTVKGTLKAYVGTGVKFKGIKSGELGHLHVQREDHGRAQREADRDVEDEEDQGARPRGLTNPR